MAPIVDKLYEAGWPENREAFEALSTLEQRRVRAWLTMGQRQLDNYHYQYQKGLVGPEYWDAVVVPAIRALAPSSHYLERDLYRPSFKTEVERILAEEKQARAK